MNKLKILNDPIYGFITIPNSQVFDLIQHKYFQRLRRITQMGMSYLVYPGAHHTRFHHAIGCVHLMQQTVNVLRFKGVTISDDEEKALYVAILLHDIGHGPFSHAMEHSVVNNVSHEQISLLFMERLNEEFNGSLTLAIQIFKGEYSRKFMCQLISGQLDMDRADYLKRDSFYTGVAEGNINSERLITMLNVVHDELVVEEKGVYSVEKFIIARRLMYWQVYLHKTGVAAELLLSNLMDYVRSMVFAGKLKEIPDDLLYFFSKKETAQIDQALLERFSRLDDIDILACLKKWQDHPDQILSSYASRIINRRLMKVKFQDQPFTEKQIEKKKVKLIRQGYSKAYADRFVFSGTINTRPYSLEKSPIKILLKSGQVKPLEVFSDLFKGGAFTTLESKSYLCYAKAE